MCCRSEKFSLFIGCPPRVFPKNGTFACLEVKGKLEICATVCEEINGDLRNIEGVTMCGFSGKRFFLKLPQDVPRCKWLLSHLLI